MHARLPLIAFAAAAAVLATGSATAQTSPATVAKGYHAPKNATPSASPTLSGVWSNATITRLERDPKYGERLVLTTDEAKAIENTSDARNARLRANTDTKNTDPDKLPE